MKILFDSYKFLEYHVERRIHFSSQRFYVFWDIKIYYYLMEFRHAFCANKIMRDKNVFFLILLLLCRFAYRDWPLFDENLKLLVNEFNTEWPFGTDNCNIPFSSYQILFMHFLVVFVMYVLGGFVTKWLNLTQFK